MANDSEAKRLADWNGALKTYFDRLGEMIAKLRNNTETVPNSFTLKNLSKESIAIEHASKSFHDAVNRAVVSTPLPPEDSPYGFGKG